MGVCVGGYRSQRVLKLDVIGLDERWAPSYGLTLASVFNGVWCNFFFLVFLAVGTDLLYRDMRTMR